MRLTLKPVRKQTKCIILLSSLFPSKVESYRRVLKWKKKSQVLDGPKPEMEFWKQKNGGGAIYFRSQFHIF